MIAMDFGLIPSNAVICGIKDIQLTFEIRLSVAIAAIADIR